MKKEPAVKKEGVKKEGVKRGKTAAFKPKEEEQEDDGREIDRPELRNAPAKYEGVVEARGDLCLFDPMTNLFMDQADNVKCQLVRTGPYKCKYIKRTPFVLFPTTNRFSPLHS